MPGGQGGSDGKGGGKQGFSALLTRHLESGTRPNIDGGATSPWTAAAFGKATNATDRTVRNWRSGKTLPGEEDLQFILDALFGNDPRLAEDRRALQGAWDALNVRRSNAARPAASEAEPTLPAIPRPSRWFGRQDDVRRITAALVEGNERAVLVLGPGGIGKTTLTQRIATEEAVLQRFSRRAFASLETAGSATDMQAAVAKAIGLDLAASLDAIRARLTATPTLLVLDNLETPWHADPETTETLLSTLVTDTDAALLASIRGTRAPAEPRWFEHEAQALPLDVAKALFLDIAQRVDAADPHLTPLLEQLGGMPLAISLVARRAAGLRRLDDLWAEWQRQGVGLAAATDRDETRLTSVTRSILFSLEAKPVKAAGRRLFSLLGQLPAGLARKDRDAILGSASYAATEQLREVGLLVDRDGRVDMLPPVRDLARCGHLPQANDALAWADHFLALTASFTEVAWLRSGAPAVDRLEPEIANIDAAIRLVCEQGRVALAVEASWSFAEVCTITGSRGDALATLLAACDEAGNREGSAKCAFLRARIALHRSDHDAARETYNTALTIYRAVGARLGEANCINSLADIALQRSEHDAAREGFNTALQIYRAVGDRLGEANCIQGLANIALRRSEHDAAREGFNTALTIYRAVGGRHGEANCIRSLADIALRRSEHDAAREGYNTALPIYRAVGDRLGEALGNLGLGRLAHAVGDAATARQLSAQALEVFRELRSAWNDGDALRSLGDVERDAANVPLAAACYRDSEAAFLHIGNAVEAATSRECLEALGGQDTPAATSTRASL